MAAKEEHIGLELAGTWVGFTGSALGTYIAYAAAMAAGGEISLELAFAMAALFTGAPVLLVGTVGIIAAAYLGSDTLSSWAKVADAGGYFSSPVQTALLLPGALLVPKDPFAFGKAFAPFIEPGKTLLSNEPSAVAKAVTVVGSSYAAPWTVMDVDKFIQEFFQDARQDTLAAESQDPVTEQIEVVPEQDAIPSEDNNFDVPDSSQPGSAAPQDEPWTQPSLPVHLGSNDGSEPGGTTVAGGPGEGEIPGGGGGGGGAGAGESGSGGGGGGGGGGPGNDDGDVEQA